MTKEQIQAIADKIVEDLFTNGFGEKSERLVLEASDDGHHPYRALEHGGLGGWCKAAVKDRIVKAIEEA